MQNPSYYWCNSWYTASRKTRTKDPRENPLTKGIKKEPTTEYPKEEPIIEDPKEDSIKDHVGYSGNDRGPLSLVYQRTMHPHKQFEQN